MSSEAKEKTDWGLRFYFDILKLESLHFGLWDSDPLDMEGMRKAQKRYTGQLLEMIPSGVSSVLDAGCGTGSTSRVLIDSGFETECLNPDAYQRGIAGETVGEGIPIHGEKFEDFSPGRSYDLILMSESSQYMDTPRMAQNAFNLLDPGGYLLIADYFRKTPVSFYKTCRVKDEFMDTLSGAGFELAELRDITEKTLPTLRLGKKVFGEYGVPVLEIISDYISGEHPLIARGGSLLLSGKLKKLRYYLYEKMPDKLDEEKFRDNMEYLFLLYRRKSP